MIVALDEGNAHSGKVNVIVIEDGDLSNQDAEDERFREIPQRILEEHKAAFMELSKQKKARNHCVGLTASMIPGLQLLYASQILRDLIEEILTPHCKLVRILNKRQDVLLCLIIVDCCKASLKQLL